MTLRKFLYQDQTEGFYAEQGTADEISLGKVTAVGVSGVAFDASSQRITGVGTPTAASDAVPKSYADALVSGLDPKSSCRVKTVGSYATWTGAGSGVGATLTSPTNATSNNDFDSVTVALNDRVLVTSYGGNDTTPAARNGIYKVTQLANGAVPTVLTRATDADENAEVTAGMYTFVTEGTTSADTGWVLVTDDTITVDTTALQFTQFSSSTSLTYDQGLVKSGSSIAVELDTAANAQGAGAGGGSSGLEFDVNSAAGKLRAAVNATGGLQRTGTGLSILNDPLSNTAGSNPTLSSGASGEQVLRAPKLEENYIAIEAIAAGDPVCWSTTNNKLNKGRADSDAKSRIVGVARTAAAVNGDTLGIVRDGVAAGVLAGATAGDPYYLQDTGGLGTFAAIGAGKRVIRVGYAKNATDLDVKIMDLGKKAA